MVAIIPKSKLQNIRTDLIKDKLEQSTQPSYYENLTKIKEKIWSLFNDAVSYRSSPFRLPVFICGDQSDFDGRIVVLRKSDQSNNLIQFHSDIRSDKIAKLKKNKNSSMLFMISKKKYKLD